jgi:hypothetical protein
LDITLRSPSPLTAPLPLHAALIDLSAPERPRPELNTQITANVALPVSFVTPDKEGVYEIVFTAVVQEANPAQGRPARPLVNLPVNLPRPNVPEVRQEVKTRRQFVVLAPQSTPRTVGDWTLTDKRTLPLVISSTEDTSPRRLLPNLPRITDLPKQITLPKLPTFGAQNSPNPVAKEIPGSHDPFKETGYVQLLYTQEHFLLEKSENHPAFSALSAAGIGGCIWHSLPLDTEIGKPYLVEIDYSVNVPQTLGICIVDAVQYGGAYKINTAANIHVAEEIVQDTQSETVATHRLFFWAKTAHPELVLVNRQPDREALFRNIRISRVVTPGLLEDQRLPKLFEGTAQRKRIGQILDANDLQTQDWNKAYETSSHLIDQLHRGGYDGVTLTVLSDRRSREGGNLDDNLFSLAPRFRGGDKVLEMMFRRFDNEGLTLIPAIEFNMRIDSLERWVQQYPFVAEEVYIGNPEHRIYNLLSKNVQLAMTQIVCELVDRFGHHPSFGGVAIVLSPESYAQLPLPGAGLGTIPPDNRTWEQFKSDTWQDETWRSLGILFPNDEIVPHSVYGQPPQNLETARVLAAIRNRAKREEFLRSDPKVWEAWVRWRAAKVSEFYAHLAQQVCARAGGLRPPTSQTEPAESRGAYAPRSCALYLLGGKMLDSPEIQHFCAPTLPNKYTSLQAIQLLGFDLPLIAKTESLHFLKPVQISETKNYCYEGLNSAEVAPFVSPLFSKSGMLSTQFAYANSCADTDHFVTVPSGNQSRKRFVQQLAQSDVLMFMDGGVSLPLGQESAMFDLLDTFRRLPPTAFETFQASEKSGGLVGGLTPPAHDKVSLQPLTIRYKNLPEGMIMYIVNDASFAVEADFNFSADARSGMTELTGHRMIRSFNRNFAGTSSHTWRASLQPYDLLAIKISDTNAKIESVIVHRPPGVESALKQKVEDLAQRIQAARGGVAWDKMLNPDFELPMPYDAANPHEKYVRDKIFGWECFGQSLTAQLDQTAVCQGKSSVRLTNSSDVPDGFYCEVLDIPATGRLAVSMFVGVPADCQSLPMSVVFAALYKNQPYHRVAPVGETLMPRFANVEPKNGVRWHQLVVPFERLPTDSLEGVRIGVQYSGIGTVWIDDVKLYPVRFSESEMLELRKMLVVADQRCSSGRVSDLLSLLDDHWIQFLFQRVPVGSLVSAPVVASNPLPPKESAAPSKPPTVYQRVKGWMGGVLP